MGDAQPLGQPMGKTLGDILQPEAGGRAVRRRLSRGGWVRLDQPQPFLCVNITPSQGKDRATPGLLAPLGSHIVCSADEPDIGRLVRCIVEDRVERFGACLLLFVWAEEVERPDIDITIHPPDQGLDGATLSALESGLQANPWTNTALKVGVEYGDVAPLRSVPEIEALNADERVFCLGLEIEPSYRNPATCAAYPIEFRKTRAALSHAIKQTVFAFARRFARSGPTHFHELGPAEVEEAVWTVDDRLADLADDFELLLHVTPVNVEQAWECFKQDNHRSIPEFHYRPLTVDPAHLKRALFSVELEAVEDPAFHFAFDQKQQELDRQISMVRDRDTSAFLLSSVQVYGRVDDDLVAQAKRLLARTQPQNESGDSLDAHSLAEAARRELATYKAHDDRFDRQVFVRDDSTGLLVSNGNLYVGETARVSQRRLQAAIQHEVGTHVLTYHNGAQQPLQLLRTGLAGYDSLQEGLAVISEYLVGGLEINRLRQLAARVLAAAAVERNADFVETYDHLIEAAQLSPRAAYLMSMRAHRGGGFTKDVVYLRGLLELLDRLGAGLKLETLLVGKMGFEQLNLIEEMLWRGILETPALNPSYLQDSNSRKRLDRLVAAPTLDTLLEDAL